MSKRAAGLSRLVGLAAFLVVAVAAYIGYGRYAVCTHRANLRALVVEAVRTAATRTPAQFDLSGLMPFSWDALTIRHGYRPGPERVECPFGWDWSVAERKALAAGGGLTLLSFSQRGRPAEFVEVPLDLVAFPDVPGAIERAQAKFTLTSSTGGVPAYTLELMR